MKKITALFLALSLFACLGTTVFAKDDISIPQPASESSGAVISGAPDNIDQIAPDGEPLELAAAQATYNVQVSWKGLVFTYCEPSKGTWDPKAGSPTEKPGYEGGQDKAYWQSSDDQNPNYATFTVTNSSSDTLDVTFSFQKNSQLTGTVRMRYSDKNSGDTGSWDCPADPNNKGLSVGRSETTNLYVVPAVGTYDFNVEQLKGDGVKLGDITITVSPQGLTDPTSPETPEAFE